jgi:hypothetical protein
LEPYLLAFLFREIQFQELDSILEGFLSRIRRAMTRSFCHRRSFLVEI